jgi:methionyl-tRNA synthetase
LVENLRRIGILLLPFMNDTANNLLNQIGIKDKNLKTWESLSKYDKIEDAKVIEKGEPLFMRLNLEEELEYIKNGMKA